jgi:hypothetical protein
MIGRHIRAADLGCGTGRTGNWLRARGVERIDEHLPDLRPLYRWIALKPRWTRYRNHPVSFAVAWQNRSP